MSGYDELETCRVCGGFKRWHSADGSKCMIPLVLCNRSHTECPWCLGTGKTKPIPPPPIQWDEFTPS